MVRSMVQIDTNLANSVISLEHQNWLYLRYRLKSQLELGVDDNEEQFSAGKRLQWNSHFPLPGADYNGEISTAILKLLKHKFRFEDLNTYPVVLNRLSAYKKYHIRWRFTAGSAQSYTQSASNRRDDSWVTWREARKLRESPIQYGQIVVYLHFYTWRVAIIKPIKRTIISRFGAVEVESDQPGPMFCIDIGEILGPAGFISKQINKATVTYIVSEAEECECFWCISSVRANIARPRVCRVAGGSIKWRIRLNWE